MEILKYTYLVLVQHFCKFMLLHESLIMQHTSHKSCSLRPLLSLKHGHFFFMGHSVLAVPSHPSLCGINLQLPLAELWPLLRSQGLTLANLLPPPFRDTKHGGITMMMRPKLFIFHSMTKKLRTCELIIWFDDINKSIL